MRTLHYYDQVGLVRPTERTRSGHRRYTEADLRRLYRVRALRQVGLRLDEIAAVLHRSPEDLTALRDLLAGQLADLDVQSRRIGELQQQVRGLLQRLVGSRMPDPEQFMAVLETMALLDAYLSREQRDLLAQRRDELGTDTVAALRSEWLDLVRGLRWHQLNGTPPDDPRVQVLAARWDAVGNAFGTGDDHVLPHLSADDEQRLLAGVDELSVVGSRVAVERSVSLAAPDGAGLRRAREVGQRAGIPLDQLIHADPRPDPAAWLNAHGWTVTDEPVHAVADRYRRNLADPYLVSRVGTAGTGAGAPTAWYTVASKVSAGR